jgi:superfamily II DNA or RNA helicase
MSTLQNTPGKHAESPQEAPNALARAEVLPAHSGAPERPISGTGTTMQLRPYQQRLVAGVRAAWAAGHRSVLGVLPTGGGKTEAAIDIVAAEATLTRRVLILTERKVLCHQWRARLERHGVTDVGVLQAENTRRVWAPVIVATAQTVAAQVLKRGAGLPDFSLAVIDEAHIWHKTHDAVLRALPDARVLGLTATPLREGLGLRFGTMVVGATIGELIGLGHLVRPRYFAPKADEVEQALRAVAIRAGDYAAEQLSTAMRSKAIIGDVVGTWQARGEGRQTIAFCVDKTHAAELAAEFGAAGIDAELVTDDTDDAERARIFADFDAGRTTVLCSVGVLAIGFDSPAASCVIMARPTMSLSLYVQQGGRGLRPYPGKVDCIVLDHAGNTQRHGLLEHFEPPADLSHVDKTTDRKRRDDPPLSWKCRACAAINALDDDVCVECGTARYRKTSVVLLDGELQAIGHEPGAPLPGPTVEQVRDFYRQVRYYAAARGIKDGFAFIKTVSRFFNGDASRAKRVVSWAWRDLAPLPPDAETSRWLRADFQRSRIAARHRATSQRADAYPQTHSF